MKILVTGAGSIGKRHAANAMALGCEVAIAETDKARLASVSQALDVKAFGSYEEGLAWMPDAVIIGTPHLTHIPLALKAIQAGAHVLIEKPIANAEEGIDEFLKESEKSGKMAFVACNMRFHPAVQTLKSHVNRVGNIYFARSHYCEHLPTMRAGIDYRKIYAANKSMGGGIIFDVIHDIDYLTWLLGPVARVSCDIAKRGDFEMDVEDYAALVMTHESGARSAMHLDYLQEYKLRGCEIAGTRGTLQWRSENKNPENILVRFFDANLRSSETLFESSDADPNEPYMILLRKFLASMKDGKADPDLLTAQTAFDELKVVLGAYASATMQRTIHIPKTGETLEPSRSI